MTALDPESLIGAVDLWICNPEEITDPALPSRYEAILSEEESVRRARLRFAHDRHSFVVSRALIRSVLSLYGDLAPEEWQFTRNRWGKPEIVAKQNALALRPNWAHTAGLVCIAVTRGAALGIDVENPARKSDIERIARRYFARAEIDALMALRGDERTRQFFHLWTLKEAYIKARGMGIASGLGKFAFTLSPGAPVELTFAPGAQDDAALWQFTTMGAPGGQVISIAVRCGAQAMIPRVAVKEVTPLEKWRRLDLRLIYPLRGPRQVDSFI